MKRTLFALLAMLFISTAAIGCRAEAEIDPDSSTTVPIQRIL